MRHLPIRATERILTLEVQSLSLGAAGLSPHSAPTILFSSIRHLFEWGSGERHASLLSEGQYWGNPSQKRRVLARRLRTRSWSYIGVTGGRRGAGGRAQRGSNDRAQCSFSAGFAERFTYGSFAVTSAACVKELRPPSSSGVSALCGFSRRLLRTGRYRHSLRFTDVKTGSDRVRNSPASPSRCVAEPGDKFQVRPSARSVFTHVNTKHGSHRPPPLCSEVCTQMSFTG